MCDALASADLRVPESLSPWTYDEEKFAELLLYVAQKADGAIKVNKYLYFSEFAAMRVLGHPISGAEYQKLSLGPAPRRLLPVRERLVREGAAQLQHHADAFGNLRAQLVPKRPVRTELFGHDELALVDRVIDALVNLGAMEVSDLSHQEVGWELVEEGETIPYELALVTRPEEVVVTDEQRKYAHAIFTEHTG